MSFCVAIDGPAAAGKGTIARAVAARFGFGHLDTGLLYRAVGRRELAGQAPEEAARALTVDELAKGDLRTPEIAQAASRVAALPAVRQALLDFQRAFAARAGGAVMDGRDIGTVICPDAAVKLYVTASVETRAGRRARELAAKGLPADYETVLADVRARDARDAQRADAPMVAAADAIHLDTTELSIEDAVAQAIAAVSQALEG